MSLAEAKLHVKQDVTDDDTLLIASIMSAADDVRAETGGRELVAQRLQLVLDSFPGPSLMGVPFGYTFTQPVNAIVLPRAPVIQVVSIGYTDYIGNPQTMAPSDYAIRPSENRWMITPPFGKIWPIPLPQIGAVQVTFDAGYAVPVSFDSSANTFTVLGPYRALNIGDVVTFSNGGGTLPTALAGGQAGGIYTATLAPFYVVTIVSPGVYQIASTPSGSPLAMAGASGGQSFLGIIPESIKQWMKLRMGSVYENREEATVLTRATLEVMPFMSNLLDSVRLPTF
jgi:hypothetical protein